MNYWLLLIPLISAFLGWFSFHMAIELLFHPRSPKKLLGFHFQGILPGRKIAIAEKLGTIAETEFLANPGLTQKIADPENIRQVLPFVEEQIDHFLKVKLKESMPVVGMFIGEKTIAQLKGVFMEELILIFPRLMEKYATNLQSQLDLKKIVTTRIADISPEQLEKMVRDALVKEFRFVKILGLVLGFIIGILTVLISAITY
jgi:uncharacterized membrane protein YheB (UPF0754 family)